ncbi:MAG: biotin--[acetyl-CoA-carboxylase] ligase [Pseudomonadota bacterium]|nr:biotin--[acetyl-CoA-carboxylase] ligase [Pseudomonadota bacterium]
MPLVFQVRLYDSLGSTNDEARRLAGAGAPHGTVVSAREQTAGRGREARRWASPPGNLYASFVLRLDLPAARLAELSFVSALVVADAVDALLPAGPRAELKWPNDVLVGGKKISGILIEWVAETAIVGIGLNVLCRPDDTTYPATSLAHAGAPAPTVDAARSGVLDAIASRLEEWVDHGFAPVRAAWLARAHKPGTGLKVTVGGVTRQGIFADLGLDGALLLETPEGVCRILAGDVMTAAPKT